MELEVYQRSTNRNIYLNKAVVAIKRLRDESSSSRSGHTPTQSPPLTPWSPKPRVFSHEAVLGGKGAAKAHFTVRRSSTISTPVKELKGKRKKSLKNVVTAW